MAIPRIRVAKGKADLVQSLVDMKGTTGPFQTYADVLAFAAALGAKYGRRIPLDSISTKETGPISWEVFVSRGYDVAIKLLAVVETKDPKILSVYDSHAEEQRIQIFEEYVNGGLEKLQEELRGAVDYSERILLILNADRFQEQIPQEEFNLSRFLE